MLGSYGAQRVSEPTELHKYLKALAKPDFGDAEWAICVFGKTGTACLTAVFTAGAKVSVGFEKILRNADGTVARDNTERAATIAEIAKTVPAT